MSEDIDKLVNETLMSLDGMSQADPGPYFYSRMILKTEIQQFSVIQRFWKPALVILFAINGLSFYLLSIEATNNNTVEALSQEYFGADTQAGDLLSLNE